MTKTVTNYENDPEVVELLSAAAVAVNDFDMWGEVWQTDDSDRFAALESLRAAIVGAGWGHLLWRTEDQSFTDDE